jgi:hypothetical protein
MDNFDDSLQRGKRLENLLVSLWPAELEATDGRRGDLRFKRTGWGLELKSEMRRLDSTPNYFVELLTSNGTSVGGPFRAFEEGCEVLGYFWPNDCQLHVFATEAFVERARFWLEDHPDARRMKVWTEGRHERFYSEGVCIPREWFKPILLATVPVDPQRTREALCS